MAKRGSIQISHQDKVNLFFFDIFLYYYKHFNSFVSHGIVEQVGTTLPASKAKSYEFLRLGPV